jgi:hypothetical protein
MFGEPSLRVSDSTDILQDWADEVVKQAAAAHSARAARTQDHAPLAGPNTCNVSDRSQHGGVNHTCGAHERRSRGDASASTSRRGRHYGDGLAQDILRSGRRMCSRADSSMHAVRDDTAAGMRELRGDWSEEENDGGLEKKGGEGVGLRHGDERGERRAAGNDPAVIHGCDGAGKHGPSARDISKASRNKNESGWQRRKGEQHIRSDNACEGWQRRESSDRGRDEAARHVASPSDVHACRRDSGNGSRGWRDVQKSGAGELIKHAQRDMTQSKHEGHKHTPTQAPACSNGPSATAAFKGLPPSRPSPSPTRTSLSPPPRQPAHSGSSLDLPDLGYREATRSDSTSSSQGLRVHALPPTQAHGSAHARNGNPQVVSTVSVTLGRSEHSQKTVGMDDVTYSRTCVTSPHRRTPQLGSAGDGPDKMDTLATSPPPPPVLGCGMRHHQGTAYNSAGKLVRGRAGVHVRWQLDSMVPQLYSAAPKPNRSVSKHGTSSDVAALTRHSRFSYDEGLYYDSPQGVPSVLCMPLSSP